ncbi:MAG: FKBP-type peptidyl-prolyl cis-trans isomerase [Solirubrobacteraceae bacterium]
MIIQRSKSHLMLSVAALAATALFAGCGGSSKSSIGIGNESDTTSVPHVAGEKAPATTPTSGPLASKPAIALPKGAAPSKLVVKDLVKGTGAEAKLGQSVTVNYVGVLYNGGKEFDSSWKRGEPATFSLENGKLITGWTQGIPGMHVGGRRELIVPAELAYGKQGQPPTIPPNAPLVFVVDLLGT